MTTCAQIVAVADAKVVAAKAPPTIDEFMETFPNFDFACYFYDIATHEYSKDPTNPTLIDEIDTKMKNLRLCIEEIEKGPQFQFFLKCLEQQKKDKFLYFYSYYDEFRQSQR